MDLKALRKAKAKLDKALEAYRTAHQNLDDDRNERAGDIYNATKAVIAEVAMLLEQEDEGSLL